MIEILASTRSLPMIKDGVSKLISDLDCLGQGLPILILAELKLISASQRHQL